MNFFPSKSAFVRGARALTIGAGLSFAFLVLPSTTFASDVTINAVTISYEYKGQRMSPAVTINSSNSGVSDKCPVTSVTSQYGRESVAEALATTTIILTYHFTSPCTASTTWYVGFQDDGYWFPYPSGSGSLNATKRYYKFSDGTSYAVDSGLLKFFPITDFLSSDSIEGLVFTNPNPTTNPLFLSAFKNFTLNFTAIATNTSRVFAVAYGKSSTTLENFDYVEFSGGSGSLIGNFDVNVPRLYSIYSTTTQQWYAFGAVYDGSDTEFLNPIAQTDLIQFRSTGNVAEYQAYQEAQLRNATSTEASGFNCSSYDVGCWIKDAFYYAFGIYPSTVARWQSFSLRNTSPFGYVYDLPVLWESATAGTSTVASLEVNLTGLYSSMDTISSVYHISSSTKVASSTLTVFNACAVRDLDGDPYANVLNIWRLALWVAFAIELWLIAHSRIF